MKVEITNNCLIKLIAENEAEERLVDEMFDHGIRAFWRVRSELGICSESHWDLSELQVVVSDGKPFQKEEVERCMKMIAESEILEAYETCVRVCEELDKKRPVPNRTESQYHLYGTFADRAGVLSWVLGFRNPMGNILREDWYKWDKKWWHEIISEHAHR